MVDKKLVEYLRYEMGNNTDLIEIHKNLIGKYSDEEIHEAMDYILYSPYSHIKAISLILIFVLFISWFTYAVFNEGSISSVISSTVENIKEKANVFFSLFYDTTYNAINSTNSSMKIYCSYLGKKYPVGSYICDNAILRVCNNNGFWDISKVCEPKSICDYITHGCVAKNPEERIIN